uniref:Transposase n=1 Tax=Chenopodium quinoa TaxID=63459 RepID=A0A803LLN9_CHEQI
MDAVSRTDIEELRKSLPPDKKLTEGRQYLVRKSKRKAPYREYYIEYLDDGKLRAECKFCPANFAADGNLNGSKNVKNHSEKCLANPVNKNKGKGSQAELFFRQGEGDKDNEEGETKLKYGSGNGEAIGKAVEACLEFWGIEDKLYSVTVDNASSNDVACAHLKRMIQRMGCVGDGKYLHVRYDWKNVEKLEVFLRGFYLLTRRISGSLYVTSNRGMFEIVAVYNMLNKWEESLDENFKAMAITMKKKFDKYWGNVDKMNKLIYIAALLDPRTKMIVVELTLTDLYGGEGDDYEKSIRDRAKRMKGSGRYVRSEFERYLNEQLGVEEEASDALTWWSRNGHRYPILSRMARDILAIPLSTVASEFAFSAGGRHLDPFRGSLTPKFFSMFIEFQGMTLDEDDDVVYVDSLI